MTRREDDDEPVTPAQCALAVVVPLTMNDFLADLAPASGKDFARSLGEVGASPLSRWHEFAPTADFVRERLKAAAALGATVLPRARLADVTRLLETHRAVTLLTHTRLFCPVRGEELRDAEAAWGRIRRPSSMILENLRDRLLGSAPDEVDPAAWAASARLVAGETASAQEARRTLAAVLNALLRETEGAFARTRMLPRRGIDPIYLQPWTRPLLEEELADDLAPSGSVELADGMKTVAELAAAVPAGFGGVIDLSTCNSLFLVGAIKRAAPRSTVLWNRVLARLTACVTRYVFILDELGRRPAPYVDTFERVTTALQQL